LNQVEKFTDCKQLQSLASELVSLRLQTDCWRGWQSRSWLYSLAYRLSTSTVALSVLNDNVPSLDQVLKHRQRLWKLWYETSDAACKSAFSWFSKMIRRITQQKALEKYKRKETTVKTCPKLSGLLRHTPEIWWGTVTNCYCSWSARLKILPAWETECDRRLLGKTG